MADEFVFLVPAEGGATPDQKPGRGDAELNREALPFRRRGAKEVSISKEKLRAFWENQVVELTDTLGVAQGEREAKGFQVDEISFAIAIGAKGGVAFVAEGSVEASLSVTLRRRR